MRAVHSCNSWLSVIFVSLMCSLLPEDLLLDFFILNAAGVVHAVVVNSLPRASP